MSVRVNVTLPNEFNEMMVKKANEAGISREKFLSARLVHYEELLQEVIELRSKQTVSLPHNARGAGRKRIFSDTDVAFIKEYKASGMSYRDIAKFYGCSVGLIHKLINEQ